MRNDVLYATDGGPIVGKIKHGKRYDSGMVSAEQYSQDMATYDERMTALHQSVLAIENTAALIRSDLSSLSADYAAVVPGLADDLHELELDVVNLKNSVKAAANAVTALEAKEAGDITAVTESISTITAGLNALADLVHEHSTAIALNETGVTQLRSEITAVKALISTNTNSITQLSNAVAELSAAQQVDKNVLTERIASVNTAVTNLTQTVNANAAQVEESISRINENIRSANEKINSVESGLGSVSGEVAGIKTALNNLSETVSSSNSQMNGRITAIQSTVNTSAQDISAIKENIKGIGTEINSEKADIQRITGRMNDYEVTQSALRNQILNVSESTTDKLNIVSESQTVMRSDIKENFKSITELSHTTSEAIADINRRIDDIVGHEDIAITAFSASPNVCEIGGTENITLNWITAGEVASQKINNEPVSGNQKTMNNVTEPQRYTLTVSDAKGRSASKSVDISFINHIYYGVDSRNIINASLVKGLAKDVFSDEVSRNITVAPNEQYIYYAYPKRLGGVVFELRSGLQGGFESPVTVSVSNHSEYAEDYYVYRSTQKLTVTSENPSVTISVKGM